MQHRLNYHFPIGFKNKHIVVFPLNKDGRVAHRPLGFAGSTCSGPEMTLLTC